MTAATTSLNLVVLQYLAESLVELRDSGLSFRECDDVLGVQHANPRRYSFCQKFWHTRFVKFLTGRV